MTSLRAPFVLTVTVLSACSSSAGEAPGPSADSSVDSRIDSAIDDAGLDATAREDAEAPSDVFDMPDISNPAGCPVSDPGFGPFHQACKISDAIRCSYGDDCSLRPADAGTAVNVYACHDDGSGSHWTLVSTAYTPECPASEPAAGSACPCSPHMQYIACLYGTCEGLDRSFANCEGPEALEHAWRVTPSSCNPPEPDGGFDGDARDGG